VLRIHFAIVAHAPRLARRHTIRVVTTEEGRSIDFEIDDVLTSFFISTCLISLHHDADRLPIVNNWRDNRMDHRGMFPRVLYGALASILAFEHILGSQVLDGELGGDRGEIREGAQGQAVKEVAHVGHRVD